MNQRPSFELGEVACSAVRRSSIASRGFFMMVALWPRGARAASIVGSLTSCPTAPADMAPAPGGTQVGIIVVILLGTQSVLNRAHPVCVTEPEWVVKTIALKVRGDTKGAAWT